MTGTWRFRLFALLVLVAVTGPAPRGGAGRAGWRGVGCGGARPAGTAAAVSRPVRVAGPGKKVEPLPPVRAPTGLPVALLVGASRQPLPPGLAGQIDRLGQQVAVGSWGDAARLARVIAADKQVPADLRVTLTALADQCDDLAALGRLRLAVVSRWDGKVAEGVVANVAAVQRADAGGQLGLMRRYLGCRATLEGDRETARRLGVTGDVRHVLRDLNPLTFLPDGRTLSSRSTPRGVERDGQGGPTGRSPYRAAARPSGRGRGTSLSPEGLA